MKNLLPIFILIIFYGCQDQNIYKFKHPQPQILKSSEKINSNFIGTFVINKDTVICTEKSINNKQIDSNLIIKNWGNYMFINEKINNHYNLSVAKISKFINNEEIYLIYPGSKKIDFKIDSIIKKEDELIASKIDSINLMIKESYTNNFEINFYVDTNNIYIDDINFNQLQQLIREDEAYYQLVTRIK